MMISFKILKNILEAVFTISLLGVVLPRSSFEIILNGKIILGTSYNRYTSR